MVIFVAIAFIVSWTPFYLVNVISQLQRVSFLKKSNFIFTMLATHLAGFINSCINPLIYILLSKKFRHCFYKLVISLCCCLPNAVCGRKSSRRQRTIYGQISYSRSSYAGDMRTFSRSSWRTSAFYRSTCNMSSYENYRRQWRHGQSGSRCSDNTNISQLGAESTISKKFSLEEVPCNFKLIDRSDYKTEKHNNIEEESHHLMYDEQIPSDISTDQAETNLDKWQCVSQCYTLSDYQHAECDILIICVSRFLSVCDAIIAILLFYQQFVFAVKNIVLTMLCLP